MDAPKLVNATRRLFTIALALLLPLCLSPGAAWAQKAASETGTLAQGGSPALASQDDAQDLPSKFDLRSVDTDGDGVGDRCYVTPVRCQYPFGTCWGFAATAAAETSVLSAKFADDPDAWKTLDFSEKQMTFFSHWHVTDTEKSNTTKGTAKIIVTGKGNFKGTKTISFKIS